MCGISGIVSLTKNLVSQNEVNELNVMLSNMIHRGPDGEGIEQFDHVIFGMRRLAIIDIQGGQQPISNEDGSIWVIMNGEIYNYLELRELLIKKGHIFKTHSDTEVILHLYEEYKDDFVHYLNGMFAICLYDTNTETIMLFRDRMGIKPLYYAEANGFFYFTSETNGLSKALNARYSKTNIASYLFLSYIPKPFTSYEGINKLLPGQAVKIDKKRNLKFYTYWQIEQTINYDISLSEAKIKLEQLLLESNSIQLRTETEFAISLSGGIDSSTILAFASASYKNQLNTISIGYEGKNISQDVSFSREVAQKFRTNHIEVNIKGDQFVEYLQELMPFIDEPISDSALIPTYIVSKEASKRGIKVLLSGAGGDELFGGYHRHFRASRLSARGAILYPKYVRKIAHTGLKALAIDNNNLRLLNPILAFASDVNGLNYSFLKDSCKEEVFDVQMQRVREHYQRINFTKKDYEYNKMHHDAENYLIDNILSLNDKAAMAASVEGRFPFIDHRIVELAFSLRPEINILERRPKGLLKEVISGYVPEAVIHRKKEGFNAPIDSWFGSMDSSFNQVDILSGVEEYFPDIVNIDSLRKTLLGKAKYGHTSENLYNLFLLIQWFKSR
jgi:asparagine synthase (glutamine-hydrolysing)